LGRSATEKKEGIDTDRHRALGPLKGYIVIYLTAYVMLQKDILPVTLIAHVMILFE
jgi:hypothetical protein